MTEKDLRSVAARKVIELQRSYLAREPAGVRRLALLRRSVTAGGSDPEVWGLVYENLPSALSTDADQPSASENALHAALSLFAFHQQSRSTPMHRAGHGMGGAVRQLRRVTGAESTVRRFKAAGSATSWAEVLHHLRGLVTQLRGHDIPLDYARLTVELRQLQHPAHAASVRRTWGRDLHRVAADETEDAATASESPADRTTATTHQTGAPA